MRADGPYEVAQAVAVWHRGGQVDDLVVENQRVYPGPRRADPNDLLPLAQVVGGVFARIPALYRHNPMPQEWKGSVKKEIFTQRTLNALTPPERGVLSAAKVAKSLEHNVLDAIALGKWFHVQLNNRTLRIP